MQHAAVRHLPFWGDRPCQSCKGLRNTDSLCDEISELVIMIEQLACPLTQALVVGHINNWHVLLQAQGLLQQLLSTMNFSHVSLLASFFGVRYSTNAARRNISSK